jgi:hypothetical protein
MVKQVSYRSLRINSLEHLPVKMAAGMYKILTPTCLYRRLQAIDRLVLPATFQQALAIVFQD